MLTSSQHQYIIESMISFGQRIRELRHERKLTLRQLAESTGVDFTYLSKIENGRVPYTPAVETIRSLASALNVDVVDLLQTANKLPEELRSISKSVQARRFFARASEIASPDDWRVMLDLLEEREAQRRTKGGRE